MDITVTLNSYQFDHVLTSYYATPSSGETWTYNIIDFMHFIARKYNCFNYTTAYDGTYPVRNGMHFIFSFATNDDAIAFKLRYF